MNQRERKNNGVLILVIGIILVLCAVLAEIFIFSAKHKEKKTIATKKVTESKQQTSSNGNSKLETFAIFGVDSRSNQLGKGTRSDSIMVASVDHTTEKVRVVSVFRDSYVDIKGHGLDKVTHAHSYGGPDLAMDTLNRNFDLKIDHYITVNFGNVAEVVDDLGGIKMQVTSEEVKYINHYIDEINKVDKTHSAHITKAGTYQMDGTQAVAYSRIRYTTGGDYKRAERQRTVLMEIFEKAKTKGTTQLMGIVTKMIAKIDTNYATDDVTDLLSYMAQYTIDDSKAVPGKLWGGKIDGVWYAVPVTLENAAQDIHKYLYGQENYNVSNTVKEISDKIQQVKSTPNEEIEQ